MKFFIFSLPRSGSAWLSVFLSGPHGLVLHEPTAERGWREWLPQAFGAVDTGAYLNVDDVRAALPDAKLFTLYRDRAQIARSCRHLHLEYDPFTAHLPDFEPIEHARLSDLAYLERLWSRTVGEGFERARSRQLIEMRIERDVAAFLREHKAAA